MSLARQHRLEEAYGYLRRVAVYRPDYPGLAHYLATIGSVPA